MEEFYTEDEMQETIQHLTKIVEQLEELIGQKNEYIEQLGGDPNRVYATGRLAEFIRDIV